MTAKLAENLKMLLQKADITPSYLSEKSGTDKTIISRMLSGKTTNPQVDTIRPIAEFFGITIEQLIGSEPLPIDNAYGIVVPVKRMLVPIIQWKHAPYWLDIKENFRVEKTIDAKSKVSKNAFALVVEDERFEPKFSIGTILIADPEIKPRDRDMIVTRGDNHNITVKQLITGKGKAFLKKVGLGFEMVSVKDYECFGVLVEAHSHIFE